VPDPDWSRALAVAYDHYPRRDAHPAPRRCPRLAAIVDAEVLALDLTPRDPKVFSRVWLRVARLAPGADVRAALTTSAPAPDRCVSKRSHLALPWGPWLVELEVACSAGKLVDYEIGDLLAAVESILGPAGRPADAFVSPCGRMEMKPTPLSDLADRARATRTLWGRPFPAVRGRP